MYDNDGKPVSRFAGQVPQTSEPVVGPNVRFLVVAAAVVVFLFVVVVVVSLFI